MSLWDRIGRIAKFLTEAPDYTPEADAGERIPSATYRLDKPIQQQTQQTMLPGTISRVNLQSIKDISRNVPKQPGTWNDSIDTLRLGVGRITQQSFTGGVQLLDAATDGNFSKGLKKAEGPITAGLRSLRSNYAFVRDSEEKTSGMGLLAALGITIGAGAAAAAALTVGAPIYVAAGAAAVGAGITGAAQRNIAKEGALGEQLKKSAELAETGIGQKEYNFGTDVVRSAAKVAGAVDPWNDWKGVGNPDYGIGAIAKTVLNIGFEFSATPDIGAGKVAGFAIRSKLGAPLSPARTGLTEYIVSKTPGLKNVVQNREIRLTAARVAEDIDLINRTVAGEKTKYTPMFEFLETATPAIVAQRSDFRGLIGQDAVNLLAGKTREEIGLVLRAGRGDKSALETIERQHDDIHNEIMRLEGAVEGIKNGGILHLKYKGKSLYLSKPFANNVNMVKAEIDTLKNKERWLNDAFNMRDTLQDRTASPWMWVERLRNDLAKERSARKLEISKPGYKASTRVVDTMGRETNLGRAVQFVYQRNPFSPFIRFIDRRVDDVPRTLINFNDPLQTPDRIRTNIRSAVQYELMTPEEGLKAYNSFITARTETERLNIVKDYTDKIAYSVGKKYKVPAVIIDTVLKEYDRQYGSLLAQARQASTEKRGYMFGEGGLDDIIDDPVLVTQLANGAILPDVKVWDKAFKSYSKKGGAESSIPYNPALLGEMVLEEFNSLWRGFTLARAGYPANIIRDSSLRMYGDMALFDAMKYLTNDTIEQIFKTDNKASRIRATLSNINNRSWKLGRLRQKIDATSATIIATEKQLKKADYDIKNPPKKAPTDSLVLQSIDSYNTLTNQLKELRRQEAIMLANKKEVPRVGRDKTIQVYGYEFPAPFSGRFGDISRRSINSMEDIRRALGTVRQLGIQTMRNNRGGSNTILPTVDESLHLVEWQQTLQDILGFDDVARMIMAGKSRKEVVGYLRSKEGFGYMDRMGLRSIDADLQYKKTKQMVDMFAPSKELHDLILSDKVTIDALRKLYPDPAARPPLLTDLVLDTTGRSNAYVAFRESLKDVVAWLSTRPTSTLMYNPYFAVKYQQKLQSMVHIANVQNRKLTLADQAQFEKVARQYAIKEYREKLNSFHRDMNYGGFMNYVLAFFPAVVEQYRAYGRIALDHPEFLVKASLISMIPQQYMGAEVDTFGNEYVEVDLPLIGPTDTKHRLPATWFNPLNPTGSPSIISSGPLTSAFMNELSKRTDVENTPILNWVSSWALPFGARGDSSRFLGPNTLLRAAEAFRATLIKNGEQFNKDTAKFLDYHIVEFIKEYDRNPTGSERKSLYKMAEKDAVALAWGRAVNAGLLPAQPQYVTPLQEYTDELARLKDKYGFEEGEDRFLELYPDYFVLADSLSNPLSGINKDATSKVLVQRNKDAIFEIVANIDEKNLYVLGAVFNDDDYAFSSSAQAYLSNETIPGTNKKFSDYRNAFQAAGSAIVNKGWNDYNKVIETVTLAIEESKEGYTVDRGYGKILLNKYKEAFIELQATKNPEWRAQWDKQAGSGSKAFKQDLVNALTTAVNNDKLWKDLSQQPKWTTIVNYLNLRYDVFDELKSRGLNGLDNKKARDLQEKVDAIVYQLRKEDINFGKFYDRYFDNDNFDYVVITDENGKIIRKESL
jgi:hypothetical protein